MDIAQFLQASFGAQMAEFPNQDIQDFRLPAKDGPVSLVTLMRENEHQYNRGLVRPRCHGDHRPFHRIPDECLEHAWLVGHEARVCKHCGTTIDL